MIVYIIKRPQAERSRWIRQAAEILEEYREQGWRLTSRLLWYRMLARNYVRNLAKEQRHFESAVRDGRRIGELDFDLFEDRTREYERFRPGWSDNEGWRTRSDVSAVATASTPGENQACPA
jgi:hypothetical protein